MANGRHGNRESGCSREAGALTNYAPAVGNYFVSTPDHRRGAAAKSLEGPGWIIHGQHRPLSSTRLAVNRLVRPSVIVTNSKAFG